MFCPQCSAPNEDDAVFCGNCGAVLNPDAELDEMAATRAEEETREIAALSDEWAEEKTREVAALPEEWVDETPEDLFESTPEPPERMVAPPPSRAYAPAASVPTSGMAIASLILGISGLTIVPFFASIAAIIIGYMARNEIRQRPDELGGDGLALAGIIMGWIAVGVTVLGLLLGGGFMLCGLCGSMGASGSW